MPNDIAKGGSECHGLDKTYTPTGNAFGGKTSPMHIETVGMDTSRTTGSEESNHEMHTLPEGEKEGVRAKNGATSTRKNNYNSAILSLWSGYHGLFSSKVKRKGQS